MRPIDVARPDPGRQAVRRVVGDGEGVGLVLELDHRQDRPEDLLARHAPAVVDAVEDGRLDVEATGLLADPLAAGDDLRPFLAPELDVAEDLRRAAGRRRSSPSRVAGSSGSPGASSRPSAAIRSTSSSRTLRWTMSREPALQDWPLL